KVDEYYQKTSNSNSYMFAMVLDPRKKLSYFQKHWPKSLQDQAKSNMEKTVPVLFASAHIWIDRNYSSKPATSNCMPTSPPLRRPHPHRRRSPPSPPNFNVPSLR
ncbi:hypothetical protein DFH06DRAFT_987267, partial [Mycena polygramma]